MKNIPLIIHYQIEGRIKRPIWWLFNQIYSRWWGVHFPASTRFVGKVCLRVNDESCVEIGNNCEFLSTSTSNWIGINNPCIISTITHKASIHIGNNCGFSGTVIGAGKNIVIGDNVRCGANTLITDSDWHQDDPRTSPDSDVVIENNVWLGYGVKVLKGVRIGENSVIGAGSIVTRNIPSNVIAAGNPCKVIKNL